MENEIILAIAKKFLTPCYIYEESSMKDSFSELRQAFPENVEIFYSIKANPNIAICESFRSCGANVELCSYYEIEAALFAGFKPGKMIFVGPAKSDKEIEKCIDLNIYCIVCESMAEFQRIESMAKKKNKIAKIALRINPTHVSKTALLKMGGKSSQFGMDEEIIFSNEKRFLNSKNTKMMGIHVYNGTRILDATTISENTKFILNLASEIQRRWKIAFEMVDIGGGFGVPYFENEKTLDMDSLKIIVTPLIESYTSQFPSQKIIIESGRYLVANSGKFVIQIIDIKTSKSENIIVTDGGTNCHMAAGGIGSLLKRNFPISLVENQKKDNGLTKKYNITGPLCTPSDQIGKNVELPEAQIGDYIVIHRSGAYGPTASPILFLSHGFPSEIIYKNKRAYLIRDRFTSEDFFKKQKLINLTEEIY